MPLALICFLQSYHRVRILCDTAVHHIMLTSCAIQYNNMHTVAWHVLRMPVTAGTMLSFLVWDVVRHHVMTAARQDVWHQTTWTVPVGRVIV